MKTYFRGHKRLQCRPHRSLHRWCCCLFSPGRIVFGSRASAYTFFRCTKRLLHLRSANTHPGRTRRTHLRGRSDHTFRTPECIGIGHPYTRALFTTTGSTAPSSTRRCLPANRLTDAAPFKHTGFHRIPTSYGQTSPVGSKQTSPHW